MMHLNTLFVVAILSLLIYIFTVVVFGGKKRKRKAQQQIPLSAIAQLWITSQQTGQLHIKDIAPLWRKSVITAKEKSEYVFAYTGVQQWFEAYIVNQPWFNTAEAHIEICYQLLRMLEQEDPCPSVVNPANDVEASWDTNTYAMLGRTSLLDHTLHVGEHTVALLVEAEAQHVIPDAMVAALGHDLGKLPSNHTHLYSLGEHPLAAGRVLAEIELFTTISRKEEITRAIKQHHMRPEGLLGKTLKKADQKARQQELEQAVAVQPEEEPHANETAGHAVAAQYFKPAEDKQSLPCPSVTPQNALARQADTDIYGEERCAARSSGKVAHSKQTINISSWFDAERFLDALKPYINQVQGRRFKAFSMPDSFVYCQPKAMEEIARKMAERAGAMDIATMGEKDKTMQVILQAIVEQFRQRGVIATDLMKEGYFGGYFTININNGKTTMKGYYTPFLAEPFGSLAAMESEKKGIIKNFSSVAMYQGDQ
ncbi:HD domain-containing protein [Desulfogranum marinum]|uniref:HD domain-containing protein n=1 Tax=Desulfogranum marinum TaxID=453220 RepID=UPI001962F11E|nr:HD domain-containing protein [Desulfogranum marinum]MBM9514252.1 HD domain-containing protein [Desulfogranum marinum]